MVQEQVQNSLTELLKNQNTELANQLNVPTGQATSYAPIYNKHAVGTALDGKFEDFGDFARSVFYDRVNPSDAQAKKLEIVRNLQNTYQEKVPSEGGFLVPEEFRAGLLQTSLESSIVRPRATVVPMASLKLRFPAIDTTTNAGSVYGGITAYWTEEGAELAESQASFASVSLEAWKLTALATVTNELVRDAAGGFNLYINQLFPQAIAYFEDLAFLKGTGVGQPLGVLNANNSALVTVSKESSQAADTIVWNNILKMYARMLPTSLNKAVWLVTPEALPQLANMTVTVKNVAGTENVGGSAVWLPDGTGTPTLTLLGRPVIITEKAGLLGDLGDIAFVDLSMYLIGDRQTMVIDSSAHAKFTSDKTVYRVIERVDGRPWLNAAITPQNGGPTLSPFVQLEAR
jgi:HK97 family phage major capsid protein